MFSDRLSLIDSLPRLAVQWVEAQRKRYRDQARILTSSEHAQMSTFFSREYLTAARLVWGPTVEEPPFYPQLRDAAGLTLIPFGEMSGITYLDTIFFSLQAGVSDPPPLPLLFHELVHVVQYSVLGTERFLNRYVRGYFERGQIYRAIPLEEHAYDLQRQYEKSGSTMAFSVRARVENMTAAY